MTIILRAALAFALTTGAVATNATTIDFESAAPCLFADTTALTTAYSGLGVTFAGTGGGNGGSILNQCGNFGIDARSGTDFLAFNTSSLTGNVGALIFSQAQSSVSFYGYIGTISARAFDAANTQIASVTVKTGEGWTLLSLVASGIRRVEFGGPNVFIVDDLSFASGNAVPEPASWAMMIAGFGLVGAAMRRRTAVTA